MHVYFLMNDILKAKKYQKFPQMRRETFVIGNKKKKIPYMGISICIATRIHGNINLERRS